MSLCYLNDLLKDLGVELGAILGLDKQVRTRDLLSGVQLVRLSTVDRFNTYLIKSMSREQKNIASRCTLPVICD